MAAKRHLFLLYQKVGLRVTGDGQDLTTMSRTNRLKLYLVQNEAKGVILGTTTGTPTKTMRFMQDLPPMQIRQKVEHVWTC